MLDANSPRAHDHANMPRMQQLDLWTPPARSAPPEVAGGLDARGLRLAPAPLHAVSVAPDLEPLTALDDKVTFYAQHALAPRTRTAYEGDFRAFERWCEEHGVSPLPASVTTLARYLTHLVEGGRKVSTTRRARIAIGLAHADAGVPRPDRDRRIRMLERGMGRIHGTREDSAKPLVIEALERIVQTFGTTARDDRDRALLLLGFAGAFRGAELVAVRIEDVQLNDQGMTVFVGRSKEDPLAAGLEIAIGLATDPALCAVEAVGRWLTRVGEGRGPLLRRVQGERISDRALRPRAVSRVVQYHARRIGLSDEYSSHSLRAGFATSAYARGLGLLDIQRHGRWQELRSLARYIDFAAMPTRSNPVSAIC